MKLTNYLYGDYEKDTEKAKAFLQKREVEYEFHYAS